MTAAPDARLTVLFDGHCGFCTRCVEEVRRLDDRGRVEFLAHQVPGVRERWGVTRAQAEYQLWAIGPGGERSGGAQAVAAILDTLLGLDPGTRGRNPGRVRLPRAPLARASRLPLVEPLLDRAYQWVARNRGRFPGTAPWCSSHPTDCPS